MNFSDLFFLYLFLPLCLIVYFISPKIKYKNTVLVVFSLIFYAWGDLKALFLIAAYALLISRSAGSSRTISAKKRRNCS